MTRRAEVTTTLLVLGLVGCTPQHPALSTVPAGMSECVEMNFLSWPAVAAQYAESATSYQAGRHALFELSSQPAPEGCRGCYVLLRQQSDSMVVAGVWNRQAPPSDPRGVSLRLGLGRGQLSISLVPDAGALRNYVILSDGDMVGGGAPVVQARPGRCPSAGGATAARAAGA